MAEKADPSPPPPSLSAYRWSRDEIPLSRREGEEVLARRVRRPRPRPISPTTDREVTNEGSGCYAKVRRRSLLVNYSIIPISQAI